MIGFLIYFSTLFNTYPIDPVSLRLLIANSDVIAVVEVLDTKDDSESNPQAAQPRGPSHTANLRLKKIIKGDVDAVQIEVRYSGNFICPSPPHFEVGEVQLVFLSKTDGDEYRSTGLSYGTPRLTSKQLTAYIATVEKRLVINDIDDEKQREAAELQWVLNLTLNPLTRNEGILELNPERYLPTGFSKDKWKYSYDQFSVAQQNKLVEALLACTDFGYETKSFYQVVEPSLDPRLTQWLKTRISKASDLSFLIETGVWLLRLLERDNTPEAREFFEEHWPKSVSASGSGRIYYFFSGSKDAELKAISDFLGLYDN
jgi:hypothetical protein